MKNVRRVAPFVVLVILAGAAVWYLSNANAQTNNGPLTASGTIEAVRVEIASEMGGKVAYVFAEEGDKVQAGQELVTLDDHLLQAQLDQALAAQTRAQANFDLIAAGLPEEQRALAVSQARMELLNAQQALDQLYENSDLVAARALQEMALADKTIDRAEKRHDSLEEPADQADIDEARAAVVLAKDKLDKAQDKFAPYENKSEDNVRRAVFLQIVAEAQNYYDQTVTRLNNLTGDANEIELSIADSDLAMAQAQRFDAERRYHENVDGPNPDDVELAEARIETAQSNLEAALAEPSQEQLALAQAEIDLAESAAQIIREQLQKMQVISPFNGVVLERFIEPGEIASPVTPLITIAELSDLRITVYVPEDRYGEIMLGEGVKVEVDSFPGALFPGEVVHISDQAEFTPRNVQTQEGRQTTVFAIKIKIENPEGKLKPGMPADVTFES